MMNRTRSCVLLPALALGAALAWGMGVADPPAKPAGPQPDAEFLEFLGSVDSASEADDGSWIEYLAQADIDKASKTATPPSQTDNPGASQSTDAVGVRRPPAVRDDRPPTASGPARSDRPPTASGPARSDRPPTASRPATGDRPSSTPAEKLAPADKLESDAKQGASKVKPDGQ